MYKHKILSSVPRRLYLVLLFCFSILFTFTTSAKVPLFPPNSQIQDIPIICSDATSLDSYLKEQGYTPSTSWFGRRGASASGDVVFVVVNYTNKSEPSRIVATITTPSGDSCLLFVGFDGKKLN